MANNNVKNIQFLRNEAVLGTRQLAIDALEAQKANVADGSIILARYGSETNIKTLAGLVYVNGNTRTVTIIDVEGASGDVETLREEINAKLGTGVTSANTATAQLAALSGSTADTSATTSVAGAKKYADDKIVEAVNDLDYTDAAVEGQYVSQVTEADGVIAVTRVELPTVAAISDAGKPITAVSESLGTIAASAGTINAEYVNITGNTFTSTTVQGALEEVNGAIGTAISGLDSTITADTGYYINKVDEVDGKLSGTTVALPTVATITTAGQPIVAVEENLGTIAASAGTINAEYVNITGNTFSSSTVQAALEEIETEYKAADAAIVGNATDSGDTLGKLEDRIDALDADAKEYHIVKTTTGLQETIKERYSLVDADGNVSGDTIDIPKDSHIVSITYDGTTQKLTYNYIDVSGNTQSTDVDMSELVLETEFGSGVTVTNHVAHGVVDPTSETFLTVGEGGFKLSGVQNAINTAISGLDVTDDAAVAGQYVAAIEETDGIVAVKTRANVSEAVLNNYAQGTASGAVASTDTINKAFGKVENQIAAINSVVEDLDASVTGGTTAGTATANHVQVIVDEADGKLTAVTVTETNIADADDLAELSGKTVTEVASSNDSITAALSAATDGTKHLDIITDASKIKMSGFTPVDTASSLSNIAVSSSVTEAFQEVDKVITENEQTVSAALNDLEETKVENINVNGVEGTFSNKVASVTIDGADIKLDGYASGSSSGAVVATDTVNQAIGKLENQVKAAVAGGLQQVEAGSGITVSAVADNKQTITAKLSSAGLPSGIAENAIKFDSTDNGMYIEYIDAGTY